MPNGAPADAPIVRTRRRLDAPEATTVSDYQSWSPIVWFTIPVLLFLVLAGVMYYNGGGSGGFGGGNSYADVPPSPLMDE